MLAKILPWASALVIIIAGAALFQWQVSNANRQADEWQARYSRSQAQLNAAAESAAAHATAQYGADILAQAWQQKAAHNLAAAAAQTPLPPWPTYTQHPTYTPQPMAETRACSH